MRAFAMITATWPMHGAAVDRFRCKHPCHSEMLSCYVVLSRPKAGRVLLCDVLDCGTSMSASTLVACSLDVWCGDVTWYM